MMLVSFLAVLVFSFVNGAWLLLRMQNTHQSIWTGLGQPTLTLSNGGGPRVALVKYIWSLRFRELNDSPLSLSCWAAITAEALLLVLFLLLVLGLIQGGSTPQL